MRVNRERMRVDSERGSGFLEGEGRGLGLYRRRGLGFVKKERVRVCRK